MAEHKGSNFNNIIQKIIEKSLFTERQIEIILDRRNISEADFRISRGAYYRQVGQSRNKLARFYYTVALLRGLGVLLPDDIDVISNLAEKISVIKDSDVLAGQEDEIVDVIDRVVRQACNM